MLRDQPKSSDLEITLIGPNVGESLLVHYDGCWFLIDSCRDREANQPAARAYLDSIGVAKEQIKLLACTHWHDDHFRGMSELYRHYESAEFWLSGALRSGEFVRLIETWRGWPPGSEPLTSGLDELRKCIDLVRDRGRNPKFAIHDQCMWRSASGSAELFSLSPSSEMVMKSKEEIAALMPEVWKEKLARRSKSPNHLAVAMHFRAGHHAVLLGSDLEEEGGLESGWSAILSSTGRPRRLASLFKVAHHGSVTAHHPGIWSDLLTPAPCAVLTPFSRSGLPRDGDIDRLKGLSSAVYISAKRGNSEIKRKGALAKHTARKKLRLVGGYPGMVRCRIDASDPNAAWRVEYEAPAAQL